MRRRAALAAVVALGFLPVAARADEPAPKPVLSGGWVAKGGARVLLGGWSAQVTAETPDAAVGSWTMTDDKGNVLMQGTWSANKGKGWSGAWSARLANGEVVSGTWAADASRLKGCKTFGDMLKRGTEAEIAGTWRMGKARGTWWLRPLPASSTS
jgi:hypothetical protein